MEWSELESWLEAGLSEGAWTPVLDAACAHLQARAVVLGLATSPGAVGRVFASSGADRGFVSFCHQHLDCYGAEEVQRRAHATDMVAWAHASSDPRRRIQDVAIFAARPAPQRGDDVLHLAQTIARVVAARRRQQALMGALGLWHAITDRLPVAVALVDAEFTVLEANGPCRDILARADGLWLYQDRLTCRVEADRIRLWEAIGEAMACPSPSDAVVAITRARGAAPYLVYPSERISAGPGRFQCLVSIAEGEEASLQRRDTAAALAAGEVQRLFAKTMV